MLVIAPATADLLASFAHGSGGRFPHHAVPRLHRPGGAGAGDEHEHVAASGDAGECPDAARARPCHRRTRRWAPRVRHVSVRAGWPNPSASPTRSCRGRSCLRRMRDSGRRDGPDHGRSDPGAARSGPLHLQPVERQDGLRAGRSCGGARRARHSGFRTRGACPQPEGVRVDSRRNGQADAHRGPRAISRRRPSSSRRRRSPTITSRSSRSRR